MKDARKKMASQIVNMSIDVVAANTSLAGIDLAIRSKIMTKKAKYDKLIALFEKSKGDNVDGLIALFQAESQTVDKIGELLSAITQMLREVMNSVQEIEDQNAVNKVDVN